MDIVNAREGSLNCNISQFGEMRVYRSGHYR